MKRREFVGGGLTGMAAIGVGFVPAWAQQAPAGGVLRRAVSSEATSLDPQRPTGQLTTELGSELFTGLTAFDAQGRIVSGCAQSWTMAADGLSWTFKLRPNLRWSDGRVLDARDFVFSLQRYLNPETAAQQSSRLDAVRNAREVRFGRLPVERLGVRAADADTLVIEMAQPDIELPIMLLLAYCVPRHVLDARGREWAKPGWIVSNGPFMLEEWKAGAKDIKLRRNPNFHDAARVRVERVEWLTGYDDPTRLRLFRLGQVDVAAIEDSGNLGIARRELGSQVRSSAEHGMGWLGLNLRRKPLDDVAVRRALSLAIDRDVLANRVRALGEAPSDSMLPPGLPGYPTPAKPDYADWPMPRRLAEARALMQRAGITPATRLRLGIGFPTGPTLRKLYLAIAAMWKPIGVDAELQPLEGRAYNAALQKGEFDIFSYASFASVPSATVFLDRFLSDSGINFCFYGNPQYDRAYRSAWQQVNVAERSRFYADCERILLRDLPVIPLYAWVSNRLVSSRVRGWADHPGHTHPSQFLSLA